MVFKNKKLFINHIKHAIKFRQNLQTFLYDKHYNLHHTNGGLYVEGKIGKTLQLFDKGEGFRHNVVTYGILMNGLYKMGHKWQVIGVGLQNFKKEKKIQIFRMLITNIE